MVGGRFKREIERETDFSSRHFQINLNEIPSKAGNLIEVFKGVITDVLAESLGVHSCPIQGKS